MQALADAEPNVIAEAVRFLSVVCRERQIRKPSVLAAARKVCLSSASSLSSLCVEVQESGQVVHAEAVNCIQTDVPNRSVMRCQCKWTANHLFIDIHEVDAMQGVRRVAES